MKQKTTICLMLLLLVNICNITYTQELKSSKMPSGILFNGYLTDKDGNSFSHDNYSFTIHIYDSQSSQTPVWSQRYENIAVKDGVFTLSIDADENNVLAFDKKYYMGIQINDAEEMPQRLEFGSTAYSLGAKYANTVSDGSVTTEKIKDNAVTSDKIQSLDISKITNLPPSIGSITDLKKNYRFAGSDYEWWTIWGNFIFGPERHFIGTRNDRDFLIQTNEMDRMRFDAHGYILLGTLAHPVDFEVFGFSIFDYLFVSGNLGVGVDPALAKMHINAPLNKNPLRIDYRNNPIFTIDHQGRVEITSTLSGEDDDIDNYPLLVNGGDQGIGIYISGNADGDNNYVSFWDDDGMAGRIEGQTAGELAAEPLSIATDAFFAALVVAEGFAVTAFLEPLPIPKEPADIIRIAADLAELTFSITWDLLHFGITYESGSGDYAEWLEKDNLNEIVSAGDIVAVNGGKISKNTFNAQKLMAISTSPIVLGNMQQKGSENNFEKVAFMGQIPVKVTGPVNTGDFIIPSGLNDGTGIAVAPELMTIEELDKIVGRAWSESTVQSVKMVNILVGINATDIAQIIARSNTNNIKSRTHVIDQQTSELKSQLDHLKNSINKLNN